MQALADYAELIFELKDQLHARDSAVIGFGGSYGGSCLHSLHACWPERGCMHNHRATRLSSTACSARLRYLEAALSQTMVHIFDPSPMHCCKPPQLHPDAQDGPYPACSSHHSSQGSPGEQVAC